MSEKRIICIMFLAFTVVFLGGAITSAHAAGFSVYEQSVSGLGTAFAGITALGEDASTVHYNPAGMSLLAGKGLSAGVNMIKTHGEFRDDGSVHVLGVPLEGSDGGEAGGVAFLPFFYYAQPLSDKLSAGISINAPYGLSTDYDSDWVGRYHAIRSELITVNINPAVSWKVTDKIFLAAGVSAQYIDAELTNAIDFGTLDALPAEMGGFGGVFGLVPQHADGYVKLTGDGWGYGFNLGAIIKPTDRLRLGLAYRSRVKQELEGRAEFSNVPAGLSAATGLFADTDARADITMPRTASCGMVYTATSRLNVLADITWTDWSTFKELRAVFDGPQPDAVTTEMWKDTFRVSAGATYSINPNWGLRAGMSFDETPIPDAQHLTPRLPGGDRVALAGGADYRLGDSLVFNLAYSHYFIDDPRIDKMPVGEDALLGGLQGVFDADADILALQLNWSF